MAASKVLVWEDPPRIDKAGHLIFPDGQNRGRGSGALDRGQFDREEEVLWPDGCAAMYRRKMLDEIGGFDEDFFAYGDDAELGLRARIAGLAVHLHAAGRGAAPPRRHAGEGLGAPPGTDRAQPRAAGAQAVSLEPAVAQSVLLRRAPGGGNCGSADATPAIRRIFPGCAASWSMAWALVRGDWSALRLAPRMLRKRREVNRLRRLSPAEVRRLILAHRLPLREVA